MNKRNTLSRVLIVATLLVAAVAPNAALAQSRGRGNLSKSSSHNIRRSGGSQMRSSMNRGSMHRGSSQRGAMQRSSAKAFQSRPTRSFGGGQSRSQSSFTAKPSSGRSRSSQMARFAQSKSRSSSGSASRGRIQTPNLRSGKNLAAKQPRMGQSSLAAGRKHAGRNLKFRPTLPINGTKPRLPNKRPNVTLPKRPTIKPGLAGIKPSLPSVRPKLPGKLPRPGIQRPGIKHPGSKLPGGKLPGSRRPGVKLPRPGIKFPGVKLPKPGVKLPGIVKPLPGVIKPFPGSVNPLPGIIVPPPVLCPPPVVVQPPVVLPPILCPPLYPSCPPVTICVPPCNPVVPIVHEPVVIQETVVQQPPVEEPVEIAPEEPAATLPQVPVGATIQLNAEDLGEEAGQVVIKLGPVVLAATVQQWQPEVTVTMPMIGLEEPSPAELVIVRADGTLATAIAVEMVPAVEQTQVAAAE